jgi:hypothetical protein
LNRPQEILQEISLYKHKTKTRLEAARNLPSALYFVFHF